jgi:hypothetical protein
MFFSFQLLESIKFVKKVQTGRDYSLLFLIKRVLLFTETNNFSLGLLLKHLGLLLLIPKHLSFCFKGFLFKNFGYSIYLANVIGFALTNILNISSMFHIARSNILSLVFFITSIRSYISFASFGYCVAKRERIAIVTFG